MRLWARVVIACLSVLAGVIQVGYAKEFNNPASFSSGIVHRVYQPLHSVFAESAEKWAHESVDLCHRRPASSAYRMQFSFSQLVEAFAAIELFQVGPLLENNLQNRLFYWPDKRRVTHRQLSTLLSSMNAEQGITVEELAQKSVALQGFTALERLLFQPTYQPIENAPQCVLVPVIIKNIAQMARELEAGWGADSDFVESLLEPHVESRHFRNSDEVLRSVFTQVKVGLDIVLNQKLQPMLSGNKKDRLLTPMWISQRTVAMLTGNLNALRALLLDSGILSSTGLEEQLTIDFDYIDQLLTRLKPVMYFVEPDDSLIRGVAVLMHQLAAVVAGVRYTVNHELSQVLNVMAGFNAQDGD